MLTQTELLKKYEIRVRGHLGQHLLTDSNVARKIVKQLDPQPGDWILEIGPGLGALTWELLQFPIHLTAVEKDKRFLEILKKEMDLRQETHEIHPQARADWVESDILDFSFEKYFCSKQSISSKIKVVSNLPYYITAPILFHLIEHRKHIDFAVLMMQKEVARRLTASAGTKDYGRLTLAIEYAARVKALFDVSPMCFTPQPEVKSAVIRMGFQENLRIAKDSENALFDLIRVAFSQRRKALAGLLVTGKIVPSRELAEQIIQKAGLVSGVRGEKLVLKDFLCLADIIKNHS